MSTFVIGDIHNALEKFENIITQISPSKQDYIYLLGYLFDRGGADPDPVGVYFKFLELKLNSNVTWIRGNHDQRIAEYIYRYYSSAEKKRGRMNPYNNNSFEIIKNRLVEVDILNLADLIVNLPLQKKIEIGSTRYLLAHAMTINPANSTQDTGIYLEGSSIMQEYWDRGVDGYVSLVGHHDSLFQRKNPNGKYLDKETSSIWINELGNVYMMDCGCGLNGRLACICLETGERFYA